MNVAIAKSVLPAVLVTVLLGTGCATVFKDKSTSMSLDGASEVTVNGKPVVGDSVTLSNKSDHTIRYRTASGEEGSCQVTSSASGGWVVASVLAGGVGWIVDLATGNWNSLDTSNCDLRSTTASR